MCGVEKLGLVALLSDELLEVVALSVLLHAGEIIMCGAIGVAGPGGTAQ